MNQDQLTILVAICGVGLIMWAFLWAIWICFVQISRRQDQKTPHEYQKDNNGNIVPPKNT